MLSDEEKKLLDGAYSNLFGAKQYLFKENLSSEEKNMIKFLISSAQEKIKKVRGNK